MTGELWLLPRTLFLAFGKNAAVQSANRGAVVYADQRHGLRHTVKNNVWLKMLSRHDVFTALVGPRRDTALIGAIVLETLDYVVDCIAQKVAPRDAKYIVSEIE